MDAQRKDGAQTEEAYLQMAIMRQAGLKGGDE